MAEDTSAKPSSAGTKGTNGSPARPQASARPDGEWWKPRPVASREEPQAQGHRIHGSSLLFWVAILGLTVGLAVTVFYLKPDIEVVSRTLWRHLQSGLDAGETKPLEAATPAPAPKPEAPTAASAEPPAPTPPASPTPAAPRGNVRATSKKAAPNAADPEHRVITLPPFRKDTGINSRDLDPGATGSSAPRVITLQPFESRK